MLRAGTPAHFAALGACVLATATLAAQKPTLDSRPAFVEVDAVVADHDERPIRGLQQGDFTIKEDGRPVTIASFSEISAAGIAGQPDGRFVVLLLDDNAVPLAATSVIQRIAKLFLSYARPADTVGVVRLTHRNDEVAGGLQAALDRVDDYQTGSLSFFGRDIVDTALQTVARVARELELIEHRRKVLVCVGNPVVCDPYLRIPEASLYWNSWRDALSAAARANATVYSVSPAGVRSPLDLGDGLVAYSGGGAFVRSNDFGRSVRIVWDHAGHYYLLGYAPTGRSRALHTIDVSVRRAGLHVFARRRRGD